MAKTRRHKNVHELAGQSLDLARKNVEAICEMVPVDTPYRTLDIQRELSLLIFRVGEAIVDQVAAASSK